MKRLGVIPYSVVLALPLMLAPIKAEAANPWGGGSRECWSGWWYTGEVWFFNNRYGWEGGCRVLARSGYARFYAGSYYRQETAWAVYQYRSRQPGFYRGVLEYWDGNNWDPGYKTHFTYNVYRYAA